jgi:hypothetical protein
MHSCRRTPEYIPAAFAPRIFFCRWVPSWLREKSSNAANIKVQIHQLGSMERKEGKEKKRNNP